MSMRKKPGFQMLMTDMGDSDDVVVEMRGIEPLASNPLKSLRFYDSHNVDFFSILYWNFVQPSRGS